MTLLQKTLKGEISCQGVGLFTGEEVLVVLRPAPVDTGVIFYVDGLEIAASVENVLDTPRCMVLGQNDARIYCVEHLLAALSGMQITNVYIDVQGPEIPIMDGSAKTFVELIESVGIKEEESPVFTHSLTESIVLNAGTEYIIALPHHRLEFSYYLHYENEPLLESQQAHWVYGEEGFKDQLAQARTFALYEEVQLLQEQGLLRGADWGRGLMIDKTRLCGDDTFRMEQEPANHKLLDLCGDISLLGFHLQAKIVSIRAGHRMNLTFMQKIKESMLVCSTV